MSYYAGWLLKYQRSFEAFQVVVLLESGVVPRVGKAASTAGSSTRNTAPRCWPL
jgi:hypothetical protein